MICFISVLLVLHHYQWVGKWKNMLMTGEGVWSVDCSSLSGEGLSSGSCFFCTVTARVIKILPNSCVCEINWRPYEYRKTYMTEWSGCWWPKRDREKAHRLWALTSPPYLAFGLCVRQMVCLPVGPMSGWLHVTAVIQDRHIRLLQLCDYFKPAREMPGHCNPRINAQTLYRHLRETGIWPYRGHVGITALRTGYSILQMHRLQLISNATFGFKLLSLCGVIYSTWDLIN